MVIERNKLMACSEEFEKWFKERFTDKLNPDSNIPGVMIMGFKELAWDAWQAGKQIGLKGRNKKDEEILKYLLIV